MPLSLLSSSKKFMEFVQFCTKLKFLLLLLALCSPCNFIQSPMDYGTLNFLQPTAKSALDFGKMITKAPSLVLRPQTPEEISLVLRFVSSSSFSKLTVAARGNGHSIHGQAQALDGIVLEMDALPSSISIHRKTNNDAYSYADVSGGALWIELLQESLKFGLAPRSWTDYLYLTIGGTLSNAGISGQSFKYGPQISNVLQLDVVTGNGDLVTCSSTKNAELFYAVLGGLGQFGIIIRARIILHDAPKMVKWVRAFYDDFDTFTKDQELLISMPKKIDYVEGFFVLNEQSIHSSSIAFPSHLDFIPELQKNSSKVYYCIEFAVHDYRREEVNVNQVVDGILQMMSYVTSLVYSIDTPYFDFLNRVTYEEMSLKKKGLWDVPHPWLNLFVPKSGIGKFKDLLLENISPKEFVGPVLIYPLLRDKWNANTSAVLPECDSLERVVYVVGILRSATRESPPTSSLESILQSHRHIAETAGQTHIGAKQYLAHHSSLPEWQAHFGLKWNQFLSRKALFDPLSILAPGQGIFSRNSYSPRTYSQ